MKAEQITYSDQIKDSIVNEYPELGEKSISVKKRFQSSDGLRLHNTYLIESNSNDYPIFIAKGTANEQFQSKELETEWIALNLLQTQFSETRLLFPEHKPKSFLLLPYIPGKTAADVAKDPDIRSQVFYNVGLTTALHHGIKIDHFGNLRSPTPDNWDSYFNNKMFEKIDALRNVLPGSLVDKTVQLYKSHKDIIDADSVEGAVMLHRDLHLDNFIVSDDTSKMVLIDFAYASGGRPLFDVGKFYAFDFQFFPEGKDSFLQGYQEVTELPSNFNEYMKLYTLATLIGMIDYFEQVRKPVEQRQPIGVLQDLIKGTGVITELLSS